MARRRGPFRLTKVTEGPGRRTRARRAQCSREGESETNQAGLATRLNAAAIDLGLLTGIYLVASSMIASVIPSVYGGQLSLPTAIVFGFLGFIIAGGIFVAFWSLAGQTPGMRFPAIRVTHDGAP